jgi:hypothetical protein
VPALRATVDGLESGAVDLLITSTMSYELIGPHAAPTGCRAIGKLFDPGRRRLPAHAQCVGEAPLMSRTVQWWKAPAEEGRTNWHWYTRSTRLPFRSMFSSPTRKAPIIGDYAMSYFPTFEPVAATALRRLRDFCLKQEAQEPLASPSVPSPNVRDLMAESHNPDAQAERATRVASLIPGLSAAACSTLPPPRWPQRFGMTSVLTPIGFAHDPYPTEFHYDWETAKAQRTLMHAPRADPSLRFLDSILIPGQGYDILRYRSGAVACRPDYPGLLKPDWMTNDRCACKAAITDHPSLSPGETTQIMSCPIDAPRVFWSWHAEHGRPVMFMEAGAGGTGVTLADYHRWEPGAKWPDATFAIPPACTAAEPASGGSPGDRPRIEIPALCGNCHEAAQTGKR